MTVTWIGRTTRATQPAACVRAVTDGGPPGASDTAEVIDDPFAVARARGVDVTTAVREATVVEELPVRDLKLLSPVEPKKILCVGRNYRAHAEEFGNEVPTEPQLFFKPTSALLAPGGEIEIPPEYERTDMESELVAVIGKTGRTIPVAQALDHVAGYTLGNDVSNRDLQRGDKQWTRGKGFDTFAPLGPWVRLTAPGFQVPPDARIQGSLDGELRQDAPISRMVFGIATVIAHISACMTLEAGDVLYTGTPQGVSPLRPGQRIEIRLEGFELGVLVSTTA